MGRKGAVEEMVKFYGVTPDTVLKITSFDRKNRKFPETLTVKQLFREVLDLFGKPSRRFYGLLASIATDPVEKAKLQFLISQEGKEEYRKRQEETITFADLLMEFKSAHLPLQNLLDAIPLIKPRYYSIASCQEAVPGSLHLCIVRVDWKTSAGTERQGLCTSYIGKLASIHNGDAVTDITNGDVMSCAVKPAAMVPPSDPTKPILMAALGTGLAPFRAFLQHRELLKKKHGKVADSVLYFGARYERSEFLYRDEFRDYLNKGVLSHLKCAFSRDQKKKIYIQDKIEEDPELVYDLLIRKGGSFFLCGPSRNVPEDIRNAIIRSFAKCGNMTIEEATALQKELVDTGRYNVEAWS